MAKRRKKAVTLTPELKLEQALVPVGRQPYPVPKNWCWIRQNLVCALSDGEKRSDIQGPYLEVKYLRGTKEGKTVGYGRYVKKGSTVILVDGENSGEIFTVPEDGYMGSTFKVLNVSGTISSNYLFYFIDSKKDLYKNNKKGSAIPHLNKELFFTIPFPLPPIAEQKRIVKRIESLFSKLDEAREKAQSVLDSFEIRKVTILQKAVAGDLTAQWRKDHDMKIENWRTEPLIKIASLQTGLMKGKRYDGETIRLPYLRVANVQDGFLDLSEVKEIEIDVSKVSRYSLKKGDVLFTEGGDFDKLGRGTVWEAQIPNCLHQNHIFVVRPNENILNPYFLSYQAGSKYGKSYFLSCSKQTTNLASINSTQLKAFPVKLPSLPEQIEIVSSIRNLLEIEQRAQELVEVTLDRIDLTKKSILAHAFCGELGTNDPNEDSALHLLKSILSEDNKTKPRRVATTVPKEDQEMAFTIVEALQKFGRLTPEELKGKTKLDIDEFYSQVKQLVDDAIIIEIREGDESYLEVVDHANR